MKPFAVAPFLGLFFCAFPSLSSGYSATQVTLPSPDGRFIARSGYLEGQDFERDSALEILAAGTGKPVFSTANPPPKESEAGDPPAPSNTSYMGEQLLWSPDSRVLAAQARDGHMTEFTHLFVRTTEGNFVEIPCPDITGACDGPFILPRNWQPGHRLTLDVSYPHEGKNQTSMWEGEAVLEVDPDHRSARVVKVHGDYVALEEDEEGDGEEKKEAAAPPVDTKKLTLSFSISRGFPSYDYVWGYDRPPAIPMANARERDSSTIGIETIPYYLPQQPFNMLEDDWGVAFWDDLGKAPATPGVESEDGKALAYEVRRIPTEGEIRAVALTDKGEMLHYYGINAAAQEQISSARKGGELFTRSAALAHWSIAAVERTGVTLLCPSVSDKKGRLLECRMTFQPKGAVKLKFSRFVEP